MNARELQRFLARQGCTFETHRGGSGHLTVRRGDRKTQLPMHGAGKELGKGLVNKILKDLGLKNPGA
jgi:mRNA interferase HicA